MRSIPLALTGFAALAAPLPALAQDAQLLTPVEAEGTSLEQMSDKLSDPVRQQELAMMARAMGEVLLDLPIAPLTEALADIAGEEAPAMDRGTTIRSLAPGSSRVPAEIEKNLPRAMEAMGALAGAMEAMAPELRAMAKRFEQALPPQR